MICPNWIGVVLLGVSQTHTAGADVGGCYASWLSPLPTVVYRNGALRLHLSSGLCSPGQDVEKEQHSVLLENESEATVLYLRKRHNSHEMFHDWTPMEGWGTRKAVGFPLAPATDMWAYPERGAAGSQYFQVEVLDEPAPSPEIESIEFVGFEPLPCADTEQTAVLRPTPLIESHIYWVTAKDGTKTVTMPFMLDNYSGEFLLDLLSGNYCGIYDPGPPIFENMKYETSEITIQAENTAGEKGEPVMVGSDSGGCGCATVSVD